MQLQVDATAIDMIQVELGDKKKLAFKAMTPEAILCGTQIREVSLVCSDCWQFRSKQPLLAPRFSVLDVKHVRFAVSCAIGRQDLQRWQTAWETDPDELIAAEAGNLLHFGFLT